MKSGKEDLERALLGKVSLGLLRKTAFQRTFCFAGLIAALMVLLVGFIYWQTVDYLQAEIDTHLLTDARALCANPGPQVSLRLTRALTLDPQNLRVGAIFNRDGEAIAGNMLEPPTPLPPLNKVSAVESDAGPARRRMGTMRVARLPLPDGGYLVFGRHVNELDKVNGIVSRALMLAAIPLTGLALAGGALLSRISMHRVKAVERACLRIVSGRLNERLPLGRSKDELHILSLTVNRMLDETEKLMLELRSAGEAIAHDLRTPLTRLNARIARILEEDADPASIKPTLERSVADINHLLAMTLAILRLSEIESGQRQAGFRAVDVGDLMRSLADFYAGVAEERQIRFSADIADVPPLFGDGDLLFEAVGNLVDNAVKFTPPQGEVMLELRATGSGCVVRVTDDGPGIPEHERGRVLRRFHRLDLARSSPGSGIGLAIVAAVAKLHDGDLKIGDAGDRGGCRMELDLPARSAPLRSTEPVGSCDTVA